MTLRGVLACVLAIASLVADSCAAWAGLLDTRELQTQTWGHLGAVYSVRRSADGLLWLATSRGPQRFDGVNFVPIALPSGLDSAAGVRIVMPTTNGDLWVATGSHNLDVADHTGKSFVRKTWGQLALARRRNGLWRIWRRADGLPSEAVRALHEDSRGRIWIGTDAGLARVQDDNIVTVPLPDSDARPLIVLTITERDNTLAVGTDRGIWMGEPDGAITRRHKVAPTLDFAWAPDGALWAGTSTGVMRLRGRATPEVVAGPTGVHWLAFDRAGALLASSNEGVHRIDTAAMTASLIATVPFTRDAVEDGEGSLWVASRALGLVAWRPLRARMVSGQRFSTAFSVLPTRAGPVWISSTAGLHRWDAGQMVPIPLPDLHTWSVRGLAEGKDGSIWVASLSNGLLRWRGHGFDTLNLPGLRGVFVEKRGALWVAWAQGGVTRFADGEPVGRGQTFAASDGLCEGPLFTHGEGANGRIWFAGEGGVSLIEGGRASCISEAQGLPALPAHAVHEDAGGDVWVGVAAEHGLVRIRQGRVQVVPIAPHAGAGPVFGIVQDGHGALWLSSERGVTRILRADLTNLIEGKPLHDTPIGYDVEEGMTVAECTASFAPSLAVDVRGDIWAPTIAGAVLITPPERWPRRHCTAVIDTMQVGGRLIDWPAPTTVETLAGTSLEMHMAAPTSIAPRKVLFQHQLHGVDKGWQSTGPERRARYASLPVGQFKFTVRALDEWGRQLGQPAALTVRSRRPWTRTALTALAVLILAGAAAFGAHVLRVRRIETRHRLVDDERRRLARDLHDGLAQGFIAVRLQLSVARGSMTAMSATVDNALTSAADALEWTQRQLRAAVWSLRNPDPRGVSSSILIARLVEEFRRQTGLQVRCVARGPSLRLSGELEHEIGQIVREALVNVQRHASAQRITVTTASDQDCLHIEVADDGRGFDSERARSSAENKLQGVEPEPHGGAGLLGIRERSVRMGASVTIDSRPGRGTRLSLSVPIAAATGIFKEQP